jgi:hypothetical protein
MPGNDEYNGMAVSDQPNDNQFSRTYQTGKPCQHFKIGRNKSWRLTLRLPEGQEGCRVHEWNGVGRQKNGCYDKRLKSLIWRAEQMAPYNHIKTVSNSNFLPTLVLSKLFCITSAERQQNGWFKPREKSSLDSENL